ncbi:TPA: restriction endonuclease subunit S [Streptococcus suis]
MTKEKPTEPRLRFPGFTDAWKQRKLGEVVDVCSGRDYKHLEAGSIPVYGTGGYMLSVSEALSENVDAIGIGRKGTIDSPYILKAPFWTVDTLFYCLPKKNFALEFAYAVFQNVNWKSMDESTGVPSLSKVRINNVKVLTPKLQEQEAIGSFFSDLDQLITLHQRKLDSVKGLKKALLQKMFPKGNGNDFPELRFPEFTDAWKQRKLGEVLDERNESRSPSADVPLVSFTVENGVTPKTERYNREFLVRDDDKKYKFTQLDDIVYNPANLKFGAIARNKYGAAVFSPIYITYTVIPDASPVFIELVVTFADFIQRALRYQEGTVYERMAVKSSDLLRSEILLPTLSEQEAIGSFFSDLDQLITLHQRQLDHLKLLKKALLQQMFI